MENDTEGSKENTPVKKDRTPPAVMTEGPTEGMINIASSTPLVDKYRMDQMNAEHNVTDMHMACDDGHVPVHRYLLMGLSPMLNSLLVNEDPSELAVIHLCGTKVAHAVQLMTLVYYGKSVVQNKEDKDNVFELMRSLGISSKQMQYRKSNGLDQVMIPKLRYCRMGTQEDIEIETTFVDADLANQAVLHDNSFECDDSTSSSGKRRRMESNIQSDTPSSEEAMVIASQEDHECCACHDKFDSYDRLVDHVQSTCGLELGPYYDYKNRKCLKCGSTFTQEYLIWGILNHVVECLPDGNETARLEPRTRTRKVHSSENSEANVFNVDSETSEVFSRAASVISLSSSVDDTSVHRTTVPSEECEDNDTSEISLSFPNEIEILEVPDCDSVQSHSNSTKELGNFADNITTTPAINLPSVEEPVATKRAPIVRKKRRKKPLVYKPHPRRSKASSSAPSKSKKAPQNNQNEQEVEPAEPTAHVLPVETAEFDEEDKESDVSTCCLIPSVDPHTLRAKLGLSPSSTLDKLSADTVHSILHQCPLCSNEFERLKDVTKCLRYHGYRYCYACLQILPCQGEDFAQHWLSQHNISVHVDLKDDSVKKVPCPFCKKQFQFRNALATHLGNFHCARVSEDNEYLTEENPDGLSQVIVSSVSPDTQIEAETDDLDIEILEQGCRPNVIVHTSAADIRTTPKSNAQRSCKGNRMAEPRIFEIKSLAGNGEPPAKKLCATDPTPSKEVPISSGLMSTPEKPKTKKKPGLTTEEILSVVLNDSDDNNEDLERRSSVETPSSISLSEAIEDNVSSTGLSSADDNSSVSQLKPRRKRISKRAVLSPAASSSQQSLRNPKRPSSRGGMSSSSRSSVGSSRSSTSRKSDSSRKLDENAERLKKILGSVKIGDLQSKFPAIPPPPPHVQNSQRGKRTSRVKPQRLIESDFEEEQERKRRAMFPPKLTTLPRSQPGSRRNSTLSMEVVEQNLQRNSEQVSSISGHKKDRPIHIIKAGVAPESVIISGRSTPSMTSDCGSESSVGASMLSKPQVPLFTPEPNDGVPPLDADNVSLSSNSSANSLRGRLTFMYQRERDGVLHNVYCKVGQPSKTIHIPADEDNAGYNSPHDYSII